MKTNNHIDEYILSRFVLHDAVLADRDRETIIRHLQECDGCRQLFEEIQSYYKSVEDELVANKDLGDRRAQEIERFKPLPSIWTEPISKIIPTEKISLVRMMWSRTKKHPVLATGGIGIFVVLLFGLYRFVISPSIDNNPYDYRLDDKDKLFMVVNRENKILWEKPWYGPYNMLEFENVLHAITTVVIDLDMDGKNDIISVIPKLNEKDASNNVVRAFRNNGDRIWARGLGVACQFRGQPYLLDFITRYIIYRYNNSEIEFFIIITHSHSPSAIYRIDRQGNIIGSYWHFGHFTGIQLIDTDGDGNKELVACGLNDVIDRPALVVLDPDKIVGNCEASPTTGYGFKKSNAEKGYYIFNRPSEDKVNRTLLIPGLTFREGNLNFRFYTKDGWMFNVDFGPGLKLLALNETDNARKAYGDSLGIVKKEYISSFSWWDGKGYKNWNSSKLHLK